MNYDFYNIKTLLSKDIRRHHISKYNNAPLIDENFLTRYGMNSANDKRILIIAQTEGDASLEYGMAGQFSTTEMIESARQENPDAKLYLDPYKQRDSDIFDTIEEIVRQCKI